jgi:cholesterol 7-dehydrogenase
MFSTTRGRLALAIVFLTALGLGVAMVRGSGVDSLIELRAFRAPLVHTTHHLVGAAAEIGARMAGLVGLAGASPWWWAVEAVVAGLVAVYGYKVFFAPLNRVRLLGEIGYIAEPGVSMRDTVENVTRRRLVGQIPPVYPNGWFAVLESRDLKNKDVRNVSCLGKNLAVFRGEDGRAQVLDAYCSHMGANLAVGGRVKGNCLECPFHGWQFRGDDGKCVHIPYCEDRKLIPEQAKVQSYLVLERNGSIYIWHHAEGNEPDWFPPEIPQISSGEWTYRGRTEHIISAHIEEIPENGADVAHLQQLHSPIMTSGVDLRTMHSKLWQFARHDWEGNWEVDPDEKHVGVLSLRHGIRVFGKNTWLFDMDVKAKQIGPGIVYLIFDTPFGSAAYLQTLTPIEPMLQRMINHVYFSKSTPTFIAKFFLIGEALQIERDLMIWNNKTFQHRPVFVKSREDTLVAKHRRWYSQFYSENSPRLRPKSSPLDW